MSQFISVIIPCYNQSQFLPAAVKSITDQTFPNWECIIVNDGSTDETHKVATELCFKDDRIKYVKKENGGLSSARNAGIDKSSGAYIQFLDADDIIEKEKLQLSMEAFEKNPAIDFVMSDFVMHYLRDGKFELPEKSLSDYRLDFDFILLNWDANAFNFPIHSPVYKADLVKRFRFNEQCLASEDWILHLQVFKHSGKYAAINRPLAVYRKHESNMTANGEHMFRNMIVANDFIMQNLVDNDLKDAFFKKVNNTWGSQAVKLNDEIKAYRHKQTDILTSTTYRLGRQIVIPLIKIKNLVFGHAGNFNRHDL